ncbi:MAG: ABC transporter permease [Burkholderiales bacterium]|nr:ABC transporter permease [Burkholderiales bacterium]
MQAFLALIRKDLVLYFSNKRALLVNLAAPIFIAVFFGSLFGGGDKKTAPIPIAVIDQDQSEVSRRIVAGLRADASLEVRDLPADAAAAQVKAGKLKVVLTLPKDFGKAAARTLFAPGDRPVIDVQFDPSQSMALAVVRGLFTQQVMQHVTGALMGSTDNVTQDLLKDMRAQLASSAGLADGQRRDLLNMFDAIEKVQAGVPAAPGTQGAADAASSAGQPAAPARGGLRTPFELRETAAKANRAAAYNAYSQSFGGMGVQFILFMAIDLGIGLLLMRRMGLWKRYRAAPLSRLQLLGASLASIAVIAFTLLMVIFGVGMLFFGVRVEGSLPGFILVVAAFSLLTASLGLLLAAVGRTPEATRGLAIFVTLILMMVGGAWVPSFVFPEWLQKAALFMPTTWAIEGLAAMTWRGLDFGVAALHGAVMVAFSAGFAILALVRFQWEE